LLGYDITAKQMLFLRRIFRGTTDTGGASEALVFPLETTGGAAASVTAGSLTATAKYQGVRGNDITVIITPEPDTETSVPGVYAVFTVDTVVDGTVQDSQTVGSYTSPGNNKPAAIGDLINNAWITWSGTAEDILTPTAGAPLTGGVTGTASAAAYSNFLIAIEPVAFNVVIYDGTDPVVKSAFASYVKTRSYDTGRYCQAVMADYTSADDETVISVKNGVILLDGTQTPANQHTWWVGGATAGAKNNQTLTYGIDPDAAAPLTAYSSADLDAAIDEGSFVMIEEFGSVKALTDINTFTSFTPEKTRSFSKNRVVRVMFSAANDLYRIFSTSFIGKIDNNEDGRGLFKAQVIGNFNGLQGNNAIQNFTAEDVEVLPGEGIDAIVINAWIQPVDAVEKIYMSVTVA
jgi:hypothetical protein